MDDLWKLKTLKKLYKPNLFPVVMDSIRGDEVVLPPNIKTAAGRPKRRRLRRRVQREGMLAIEETEGNNASNAEASHGGPIESEENSMNRTVQNENPME